MLQKRLEAVGCAAVMPLAAPIGSGRGLKLRHAIEIMVEQAEVPVVVDAGLGAPSHAAESMELGADAVLVNTAIARADDPAAMAHAFRLAVEAGRTARLAGLIEEHETAEPSSPLGGLATPVVNVTVNGRVRPRRRVRRSATLLERLGWPRSTRWWSGTASRSSAPAMRRPAWRTATASRCPPRRRWIVAST